MYILGILFDEFSKCELWKIHQISQKMQKAEKKKLSCNTIV